MLYYALFLKGGTSKRDRGPHLIASTSKDKLERYLKHLEKLDPGFRIKKQGKVKSGFVVVDGSTAFDNEMRY